MNAQPTGTPTNGAPATPAYEPTGDIVEDAIAEFEAKRATEKPAETETPEGEPRPAEAKPDGKEDLSTPEGIAKAREGIEARRAELDRKFVEMSKREKRGKEQRANEKREYQQFVHIRDAFMADVATATSGTTEQALNALTRLRAAAGQKGEDFLTEAQLAVARNGKKKEADPEVAALRNELAEVRKELKSREESTRTDAQQQAFQRRSAEVADAVCAPTNAVASQLAVANRSVLFDMALSYKTAYFEARNEELPDADAAKLVERDLGTLTKFPRVLAYAKLGNLAQIVQTVRNLHENEGLDDAAAIGKIDGILAANFGSAPQGDLGRATQAQAEPVEPASDSLPGRTVSQTRASASAGSVRKLTKEERIAEMLRDGTLEELGITFQN